METKSKLVFHNLANVLSKWLFQLVGKAVKYKFYKALFIVHKYIMSTGLIIFTLFITLDYKNGHFQWLGISLKLWLQSN